MSEIVYNLGDSAVFCAFHDLQYMYLYLYSYRRQTARQLRMYAQLTRCFSAVAELLVVKSLRL